MKNWAVAIGIILLILAAVLLKNYGATYATANLTQGLASSNSNLSTWECTGNFLQHDVIMLNLLPNMFWFQNPSAFDVLDNGQSIMYVYVNITDPANGVSYYELWYTFDQTTSRYSVYNATALSFGEGINSTVLLPANFNMTYTLVAGTAQLNGTYVANVTFVGNVINFAGGEYKPSAFQLYYGRTALQLSQPYTNLQYVGYAAIPTSVIFLAYGLIKRPKSIRKTPSRNTRHPNNVTR